MQPKLRVLFISMKRAVGERSMVGRSPTGRTGGRDGSDYADMSNDKAGEKPARRKPKVS